MSRKLWLDYSRAFACVLVAVGHLLMSFEGSILAEDNSAAAFFVQMIYHFHVYIFFFCSGFLFQLTFEKYSDKKEYIGKKIIRCLDFAVPYMVFSFITYGIKMLLGDSVNTPVEASFLHVLVNDPINQMWYLYAIIVVTVMTPVIKSAKGLWGILTGAIVAKAITLLPFYSAPVAVDYWLQNQIWFVLGMVWSYKHIKLKKWISLTMMGGFVVLCIVEFAWGMDNNILDAILTFIGVVSSVEVIRMLTEKKTSLSFVWNCLTKYMLQIYLLHTICAAGIRIILLKLDVTHFAIHAVLGLGFSFVLPVVCAMIAERMKICNVVFYPSKTILQIKQKKQAVRK